MTTGQAAHTTSTSLGPLRDRNPWQRRGSWVIQRRAQILTSVAVIAIAVGGLLHVVGASPAGHVVWRAAVALLAAELTVEVVRSVVVERSLGVDTIALVAMIGGLALGRELAGAVIGLMFSGGATLEAVWSAVITRASARPVPS